jgi:hypothetical protein
MDENLLDNLPNPGTEQWYYLDSVKRPTKQNGKNIMEKITVERLARKWNGKTMAVNQ